MTEDDKHQEPGRGTAKRDIELGKTSIRSGSFDDDTSVRPKLTTTQGPATDSADTSDGSDE